MQTLARKNKQTLYYALLKGEEEVYDLDENGERIIDYIDSDGVAYYRTTGEKKLVYYDPVKFECNISFSGNGESNTVEYGVDTSAYDASVVIVKGEYPLTETTLVWHENAPTFKGKAPYRTVDPDSADYKVLRIKNSLNISKILLGRLVK